jgi:hypothetical protein
MIDSSARSGRRFGGRRRCARPTGPCRHSRWPSPSSSKRDAMREPCAEALARRALERHMDRVVGQARMAVALGDFARQHRAGRAVDVVDRHRDAHGAPRPSAPASRPRSACGRARCRDCGPANGLEDRDAPRGASACGTACEKSSPLAFQCSITFCLSSICIWPIISLNGAVAQLRHHLAHFLGDEEEVVDDVLGLRRRSACAAPGPASRRRPGRC